MNMSSITKTVPSNNNQVAGNLSLTAVKKVLARFNGGMDFDQESASIKSLSIISHKPFLHLAKPYVSLLLKE
eukprot:snap_masked-scaffold_2-processed-gene-18.36-mRNA-1 protein AED:1.00 eAED:1.00 QI:0/0/0/0/1/1/2/0/71